MAISEEVDESNPKFWITHMNYDLDKLMQDVLWDVMGESMQKRPVYKW